MKEGHEKTNKNKCALTSSGTTAGSILSLSTMKAGGKKEKKRGIRVEQR